MHRCLNHHFFERPISREDAATYDILLARTRKTKKKHQKKSEKNPKISPHPFFLRIVLCFEPRATGHWATSGHPPAAAQGAPAAPQGDAGEAESQGEGHDGTGGTGSSARCSAAAARRSAASSRSRSSATPPEVSEISEVSGAKRPG